MLKKDQLFSPIGKKKGRVMYLSRSFGDPAVSERPNGLSVPSSRTV